MRAIIWISRLLVFFLLFGFAIKNDQLITLNFFFGSHGSFRWYSSFSSPLPPGRCLA